MADELKKKMKKFIAWILGVINNRIDCPKCGGFRTGENIGSWAGVLDYRCQRCTHAWGEDYD